MKTIRFVALLLLCTLVLCSCSPSEENPVVPEEAFTALFRFSISSLEENKTRISYCKESDGFFYLHGQTGGGFLGGFVSPERSMSCESVVKSTAPLTFSQIRENGEDKAILLTDGGVFHTLFKENTSQCTPLPTNLDFSRAVFYDDLTLIAETEELLVLCPVDFENTYVLSPKEALPDFAGVIAVTEGGKRIWYAQGRLDGTFKGIAFFEYGENVPLGSENFLFDSFTPIGTSSVLFSRKLADGGALYLMRNLETGETGSVTTKEALDGVTCDPAGTVLCGSLKKGSGGEIQVYDLTDGTLSGTYSIAHGAPSPYLAVSDDAETLLFAVSQGTDEVIGALDLTKI